MQTPTRPGFDAYTAAFDGVNATGEMDIQSIVPKSDEIETGAFVMTIVDDAGGPEVEYTYSVPPEVTTAGWYDETGTELIDKTFLPGEGFLINSAYDVAGVQTAGQVSDSDSLVSLLPGFNAIGNSTPVDVNLTNITVGVAIDDKGNFVSPNQYDEALETGGFVMTIVDDAGGPDVEYTYSVEPEVAKPGWYDETGTSFIEDCVFGAGKGFLINSAYTEGYLKIPSAL